MTDGRSGRIIVGDHSRSKVLVRIDNPNDVPEGAVPVTEQEALEAQMRLLDEWHPKEEIWPFIHGKKILAGVTGLTGFLTNGHIRSFFHLTHQKMMTTLVPSIIIPYLISQVYHATTVSQPVLLGNVDCPACLSTRSGFGQIVMSSISALGLTTVTSYAVANLERTHPLPTPWDFRSLGRLGAQVVKTNRNFILGSMAVNFLFGYWLAHKEMKSYIIMQLRLVHGRNVMVADSNKQISTDSDPNEK